MNRLPPLPSHTPNIGLLPAEIQRKIYEEHFSVNARYESLLTVFQSFECRKLNHRRLTPIVKQMLIEDTELLKYTLKRAKKDNTEFDIVYSDYIKGIVHFKNISCPYENLTLSWLFTKYH